MAAEKTQSTKSGAAGTDDLVVMQGRSCPICAKPAIVRYRPFCSKRCADVDLQRWFTGSYAVPVVEEDRSADDDEAQT